MYRNLTQASKQQQRGKRRALTGWRAQGTRRHGTVPALGRPSRRLELARRSLGPVDRVPVNRLEVMGRQVLVGQGKVLAPVETGVRRERRRVGGLEDQVLALPRPPPPGRVSVRAACAHGRSGTAGKHRGRAHGGGRRTALTDLPAVWAGLPQSMKTTLVRCVLMARTTASVSCSQPWPACDLAAWARTVRHVFSSRTPARR